MKIVNYMNFVRLCDPRIENSEEILYETTRQEFALGKEYGIPQTFLLQYDAMTDARYIALFGQESDENLELGLWYEIVKPLVDKAGIPWRGREGWTWDWHVVPGFSMAYTQEERERLITIAMEDFREIYGQYPKTVASWLLDSHTAAYLEAQYKISVLAICRDQTETDAYTLVGGYFNQGYYPSRKNLFTPAQTKEESLKVPVLRLLGPDPIHNYDNDRYITDQTLLPYKGCYTLEPAWKSGYTPEIVDWFLESYFDNVDLGFSYAQLGQENSFGPEVLPALRMQLEKLKEHPDINIWKMCDTGEWFRERYPDFTPATCVSALKDWNGNDQVQSVYYDCKNYMVNLFRWKDRIFFRSMYLFNEQAPERYLEEPCTTWDAVYENLPMIDTLLWKGNEGLTLDENGGTLELEQTGEGILTVRWKDREVVFEEDAIRIRNAETLKFDFTGSQAQITVTDLGIQYCYRDHVYDLHITGGVLVETGEGCSVSAGEGDVVLTMGRKNEFK